MGSSFTEYRGEGFWASDGAVQVWLAWLAREADASSSSPEWLRSLAAHWVYQATWGISGGISAGLDSHLDEGQRREAVVALAESALLSLRAIGPTIPAAALSDLAPDRSGGGTWTQAVETEKFCSIGEAFVSLLKGQLKTEPGKALP